MRRLTALPVLVIIVMVLGAMLAPSAALASPTTPEVQVPQGYGTMDNVVLVDLSGHLISRQVTQPVYGESGRLTTQNNFLHVLASTERFAWTTSTNSSATMRNTAVITDICYDSAALWQSSRTAYPLASGISMGKVSESTGSRTTTLLSSMVDFGITPNATMTSSWFTVNPRAPSRGSEAVELTATAQTSFSLPPGGSAASLFTYGDETDILRITNMGHNRLVGSIGFVSGTESNQAAPSPWYTASPSTIDSITAGSGTMALQRNLGGLAFSNPARPYVSPPAGLAYTQNVLADRGLQTTAFVGTDNTSRTGGNSGVVPLSAAFSSLLARFTMNPATANQTVARVTDGLPASTTRASATTGTSSITVATPVDHVFAKLNSAADLRDHGASTGGFAYAPLRAFSLSFGSEHNAVDVS